MSTPPNTTTPATGRTAPVGGLAVDLGSSRGRVLKGLVRDRLGLAGGVLLLLVVAAALLAPVISPHSPTQVHFETPFQQWRTTGYPLGTDDLGRDVLSRVLHGTRASLEVGVLAVALSIVVGTPLGLAAGYWRRLDGVVSRLTDLTLAFPFLVLAVGLAAIRGASLSNAAIALGIAHVPQMIRVVRAETLRLKGAEYVLAARSLDASGLRILATHVLPNAVPSVIVQATVIMPAVVIGEALLSFLGLGIQPPTPSLGIMLSDAQQYIFRAPSAALFPGLAIVVICLAVNLFGDALRDALEPGGHR